jgi:hypothetical protein
MQDHLTEALRTNRTGGKTVAQLLDEAAQRIAFMSMEAPLVGVRPPPPPHGIQEVLGSTPFGHTPFGSTFPSRREVLRAESRRSGYRHILYLSICLVQAWGIDRSRIRLLA